MRPFNDLCDARLRDNLIPLEWQHRYFTAAALSGPHKYRIHGRVHIHNNRPLVLSKPTDLESLTPTVIHWQCHNLLIRWKQRRVPCLRSAGLLDALVRIAGDFLLCPFAALCSRLLLCHRFPPSSPLSTFSISTDSCEVTSRTRP